MGVKPLLVKSGVEVWCSLGKFEWYDL
jgi:hypothetical protein